MEKISKVIKAETPEDLRKLGCEKEEESFDPVLLNFLNEATRESDGTKFDTKHSGLAEKVKYIMGGKGELKDYLRMSDRELQDIVDRNRDKLPPIPHINDPKSKEESEAIFKSLMMGAKENNSVEDDVKSEMVRRLGYSR